MYIYIYTYLYIHMYIYIHTYIRSYTYTCICTYSSMSFKGCLIFRYVSYMYFLYIYIYMLVICVYIYMLVICVYIYICIFAYIYINIVYFRCGYGSELTNWYSKNRQYLHANLELQLQADATLVKSVQLPKHCWCSLKSHVFNVIPGLPVFACGFEN